MQNPQGAQETGPPPTPQTPAPSPCLVTICSQRETKGVSRKGQGLRYRWRCYSLGPLLPPFQKTHHGRLADAEHIPILLATPPKESLCCFSMYFVSKTGNPGIRNKSLTSYIFTLLTVSLYIFINTIK